MQEKEIQQHDYKDLIAVFNETFEHDFNTKLEKGYDEPIYIPADIVYEQYPLAHHHRVIFAHGYYASGLHEIAHWLVAGEQRRQKVDYGYWYIADGRNAKQQKAFEKVEVVPQAIEWIIAVAAGFDYKVSADNLSGIEIDRVGFQHQIYDQVKTFLEDGLSPRTQALVIALQKFYNTTTIQLTDFEYRGMYARDAV